jgi:hypothetical protein
MAFSVSIACLNAQRTDKVGMIPATYQTKTPLFKMTVNKDTPTGFSFKCPYCKEEIEFKSIKSHVIEPEEKKPKGFFEKLFGSPADTSYTFVHKGQTYGLDQLQLHSRYHRFTVVISSDGIVFPDPRGLIQDDTGKNVAYCPLRYADNYQNGIIYGQWYDWENGVTVDIGDKYQDKPDDTTK